MKTPDSRLPDIKELEMLLASYTKSSVEAASEISCEFIDAGISAYDELMGLTGLDSVKKEIAKQVSYLRIMQLREESGKRCPSRMYNIILSGNPGTGKTMVARLIAKIFHEIGFLSKGHLVEVSRASLVGRYIGETEANTMRYLKTAEGGVLFIDEIYSLAESNSDDSRDFGIKVIDTLLPRITDLKDTVIIGAGYTNNIRKFLDSNPGLKSRFPILIECPDYSTTELVNIAMEEIHKLDFDIDHPALECLKNIISNSSRHPNFGNARFVKSLVHNHIIPGFCNRIYKLILCGAIEIKDACNMSIITKDDMPSSLESLFPIQKNIQKVGYRLS